MKSFVEVFHDSSPFLLSVCHFIKLFLNIGCEVIIQNIREVFVQKVVYYSSDIRRNQFRFFCSYYFSMYGISYLFVFECQYIKWPLFSRFIAFLHIFTLLDGRDSRCICWRTPNSKFFQLAYQAGFGIAWRTLGEALCCYNIFMVKHLPFFQWGKQMAFIFLFGIIIIRLFIYTQEAIKGYYLSDCCESIIAGTDTDSSCCFFQFGFGHLWSNGTLPYQVIQPFLLWRSFHGSIFHIGRTDRFVRFLCSFGFCSEVARVHIPFAHHVDDSLFASFGCIFRKVYRVGTHISNESGFV